MREQPVSPELPSCTRNRPASEGGCTGHPTRRGHAKGGGLEKGERKSGIRTQVSSSVAHTSPAGPWPAVAAHDGGPGPAQAGSGPLRDSAKSLKQKGSFSQGERGPEHLGHLSRLNYRKNRPQEPSPSRPSQVRTLTLIYSSALPLSPNKKLLESTSP